ncbi:heat-shock protein Hsp20 [Lysinibacillus sp. PLM2]|nr:heat-shock protein Hsp20 [Lysinibacillus sp. PLM2]
MFDLSPFRQRTDELFNHVEKVFAEMLNESNFPILSEQMKSLRSEFTEGKDAYFVEVGVPGFAKEDIQINLENNKLTIFAKRDERNEMRDKDDQIIRYQRQFGQFVRQFYVRNIDQDRVKAQLDKGLLKIKLPKLTLGDTGNLKRIEID